MMKKMITAKTYREWEQVCEPWKDTSTNRWYVNVKNPKNGSIKKVRLYREKPGDRAIENHIDTGYINQKYALGFEKGFITIFKGINNNNEDWFKRSDARNHRVWGWYYPSTIDLPEDLPSTVTPVKLEWAAVGNDTGALFLEEKVKEQINAILN